MIYILQTWLQSFGTWFSSSMTPTSLVEALMLQQHSEYECGFVCRVISLYDTDREYFIKHYPALVP